MQAQKYKILLFITLIFLGCSDNKKTEISNEISVPDGFKVASKPNDNKFEHFNNLDYINSFRLSSSLLAFKKNDTLSTIAYNHAKYNVENNNLGHDEENAKKYFSGATPKIRAHKANYKSNVDELIINDATDFDSGIDTLLSDIYNRLLLLSLNFNEIGIGEYNKFDKNSVVLELGNSKMERFCKDNVSDGNATSYINGICENQDIKISQLNFNRLNQIDEVSVVYFPNSDNTKAFYSANLTNPIPECKITANPISISFNPLNRQVLLEEFKIFDDKGNEIKNTKLITEQNDPNKRLSKFDFVLIPKDAFEFNKNYRVEVMYHQKGEDKRLSWEFRTKTPPIDYFDAKDGDILAVENNKEYDVFIRPRDCMNINKTYEFNYQNIDNFDIKPIDSNMLRVKLNGSKGGNFRIITNDNSIITLRLIDGDELSFSLEKYKNYIIFALFSISLLFGKIRPIKIKNKKKKV